MSPPYTAEAQSPQDGGPDGTMVSSAMPSPGLQTQAPRRAYPDFSLSNKVYIITGGGRGIGLVIAEAMVQAGAEVHCLDLLLTPEKEFQSAQTWAQTLPPSQPGSLHYHHVDVRATDLLTQTISSITARSNRLDGLVAAAGIQQIQPALDETHEELIKVLEVNYVGLFLTAQCVAREMIRLGAGSGSASGKGGGGGSIVFVASMSGFVANKGMDTAAYNSSKAAVVQLTRNLAMEWGKYGIRVNALCPGHVMTPMVLKCFAEAPGTEEMWKKESMLGRLAQPDELTGAAIFMLSQASSYMTGSHIVIDGGHTAW